MRRHDDNHLPAGRCSVITDVALQQIVGRLIGVAARRRPEGCDR